MRTRDGVDNGGECAGRALALGHQRQSEDEHSSENQKVENSENQKVENSEQQKVKK